MVSVAAHIVIVPILARFGAFEHIRRQFGGPTVTVLPPVPEARSKDAEKRAEPKKATSAPKRAGAPTAGDKKSNLNQPRVIASSGPPDANGSGPLVDPEGSGKAGVVPSTKEDGPPRGNTETSPETTVAKPGEAGVAPPVEKTPEPETKEPEAKVVEKPHAPVLVGAVATYQPQPEIPDELRTESLDRTTVLMVEVLADGTVGETSVQNPSGVSELDQLAVRAAKRWKFTPATKDGEPIRSHVRLHVRFKVDQ